MKIFRKLSAVLLASSVIAGGLTAVSESASAAPVSASFSVSATSASFVNAVSTSATKTAVSPSEVSKVKSAAFARLAHDSGISVKSMRAISVKFSKINSSYAYVDVNSQFGPVEVLLSKVGRTWRVVTYGTGGFDCNDAPLAVMRNVGATVYECVPGQRYFVYTATQKKVIAAAMIHAKYYVLDSNGSRLSKKGLAKQLAFEKFPTYAINAVASSIKANWNANATVCGWRYLELGVSPTGIYDQLVFDGFTSAEASYAVRHLYDK